MAISTSAGSALFDNRAFEHHPLSPNHDDRPELRRESVITQIKYALIQNKEIHGFDRRDVDEWLDDEAFLDDMSQLMWMLYSRKTGWMEYSKQIQKIRARIDDRIGMLADEVIKNQ